MDCMYASTREVDQLSKWQGVGHFHTALHNTLASAEKTWVSPHCPTMLTSHDSHISCIRLRSLLLADGYWSVPACAIMARLQETSLWANRKCLLICSAVAIASMQYGIDTAAVGGLQAMPGFLMVFGYEDPTSPLGYGIDASPHSL